MCRAGLREGLLSSACPHRQDLYQGSEKLKVIILTLSRRWGGGTVYKLVVLYLLFTSSDFTTKLAPHCGAFSRALKIENIKGPLFPGPEGAVNTNGWCINWMSLEQGKGPTVINIWLFLYLISFILQSGMYTKYILPMASDGFLEI